MLGSLNNVEALLDRLKASGVQFPEAKVGRDLNDGELKGVNCPECNNRGYISYTKNGCLYSKPCKCMSMRGALMLARKSGLDDIMKEYTFKSFSTPGDWERMAKEKAVDYVRNGSGKWFYISGAPGSGKTHLCTAICSALLKSGTEVKYVLWRDIAQKLKTSINDPEYERLMDNLKRPQVLYIDDFLKGTVSDADINRAFEIINARYNATSKRTIISSERDLSDVRHYDEAVGSRIVQRSKGYCLKTTGKNWRN